MRSIGLLLLFVALAAGCSERPSAVDRRPVLAVRLEAARREPMTETAEVGGAVRARTIAVVSSRIVAPVVEVPVRAGDRVKAGQPLVLLDARELRAGRAKAEASLASATEGLSASDAATQAARSALTLAVASHRRIAQLHARNSATAGELDEAEAALRTAEAGVKGAAARHEEALGAVEAARAGVNISTVAESYATLTAPFDGVVETVPAEVGMLAVPGVPLVTVEDARQFRLELSVDATHIAALSPGSRLDVDIDGVPSGTVQGVVAEIGRAIDPVSHTGVLKVDLPAIDGLRTGLYGRARLSGSSHAAITVPSSALVRRGQLTVVFVEDRGVARMRLLHAGREIAGRVAVLAGINEGDRVVVEPPAGLTDGTPLSGLASPGSARGPR